MRALVCRAFGDYRTALKLEEVPSPELPPRGVRIAVDYASVSFAMSLWIAGKYQRLPPLPFTPGTEVTGTVTEIKGKRIALDVSIFGRPGNPVSIHATALRKIPPKT